MEEEEEFVVLLRRNWLPPERREIEPVSELLALSICDPPRLLGEKTRRSLIIVHIFGLLFIFR